MASFLRCVMFLVGAVIVISCSKAPLEGKFKVNDPQKILNKQLKDSLQNLQLKYFTRLEVVKSLPFGSEEEIMDSLWNIEPTAVLIVASQHPDYIFVRMSDCFDGAMSAAQEGTLGSSDYYKAQLSDSLDINGKVICIINQLLKTESVMTQTIIVEYIKGEIFGPLYSWTLPDDSKLYRFVFYPAQRPFVWMINLTGNYFVGMFLAWLILFGILMLILRLWTKRLIRNRTTPLTPKETFRIQGICGFLELFILGFPCLLGALSVGVQVSNIGAEFSRGLIEHMGLSYAFVDNFYQGFGSQPSTILTVLACLCYYWGHYNHENNTKATVGTAVVFFVLLGSSAAFAWTVFILFLYRAIFNSKEFYKVFFVDAMQAGISTQESLGWLTLHLTVVIGAASLGHWFGLRVVNIDTNQFQVHTQQVRTELIDKPRPHIEEWFCQFDEELKLFKEKEKEQK